MIMKLKKRGQGPRGAVEPVKKKYLEQMTTILKIFVRITGNRSKLETVMSEKSLPLSKRSTGYTSHSSAKENFSE
jgi:hypothetical protein